jgi:hypothetical protein
MSEKQDSMQAQRRLNVHIAPDTDARLRSELPEGATLSSFVDDAIRARLDAVDDAVSHDTASAFSGVDMSAHEDELAELYMKLVRAEVSSHVAALEREQKKAEAADEPSRVPVQRNMREMESINEILAACTRAGTPRRVR